MRTYVIRFRDEKGVSAFNEIVAGTEADAREDFHRRFPTHTLLTAYVKPRKGFRK